MPKPRLSQDELRARQLARQKAWREDNKQKRAEYILKWRKENADHVAAYRESYERSPEIQERDRVRQSTYYREIVKNSSEQLEKRRRYAKAYSAAHPDKGKARTARYNEKNRKLLAAKANAAYHAKPPDQRKAEAQARKEYLKQWATENKERLSAERRAKYDAAAQNAVYRKNYEKNRVDYIQRANARQRLLVGRGKFTQQDIDHLYEQQDGKCTGCTVSLAEGYEIDHVMPISLGGSNTADNLQLLCMPCNRRKHDMHPDEWKVKLKSA